MESSKSEQYIEQRNVIQQYMINGQFVEAEREVIRLRKEMEKDDDWRKWCEYGRADLKRRIKQPFWIYDL